MTFGENVFGENVFGEVVDGDAGPPRASLAGAIPRPVAAFSLDVHIAPELELISNLPVPVAEFELELTGAPPLDLGDEIAFDSVSILLVDDLITADPLMQLAVLEPNILERAPALVTVAVTGGQPGFEAVLDIDGTDVMTVMLDTSGGLGATTLSVTETLGAAGSHVVTVTQVMPSGAVATSSGSFTVLLDPTAFPTGPAADAAPEDVPDAEVPGSSVRRWVLQDLAPGGLGSYVFPQNPKSMTSPHFERLLTKRRTKSRRGGRFHIFQAAGLPKEWQFDGYAPTEEMCEALQAYRDVNRRLYLIDHRNRAWQVVITHADIRPRLRHTYNGEETDWGSDYTVSATILNQTWTEPA